MQSATRSYKTGGVPFIVHQVSCLKALTVYWGASRRPTKVHLLALQTWKNHNLPARFQTWSATWNDKNPDWLHVLWSDEENRRLVKDHYTFFLPLYDSFEKGINRADAVRQPLPVLHLLRQMPYTNLLEQSFAIL